MEDTKLYGNLTKEQMDTYTEEARQRWGNTAAFKQSEERVAKMGKAGLKKVLEESKRITVAIAEEMKKGSVPESAAVQELIAKHYNWLRAFYEPNLELYRGLAEMYVADPRFKANYERVAEGLAEFLSVAMLRYAEKEEGKK